MRTCFVSIGVVVCTIAACTEGTAPVMPTTPAFGRVTATIDGQAWGSTIALDSTVGFTDTVSGFLQIFGAARAGSAVRSSVTINASSWTARVPRTFALMDPAYCCDSAPNAIWSNAEKGLFASSPTDYYSNGTDGDSLWIDGYDPATRAIRGRFRFAAAKLNEATTTISINGQFEGRLQLIVLPRP